jgi:hypothetical protein
MPPIFHLGVSLLRRVGLFVASPRPNPNNSVGGTVGFPLLSLTHNEELPKNTKSTFSICKILVHFQKIFPFCKTIKKTHSNFGKYLSVSRSFKSLISFPPTLIRGNKQFFIYQICFRTSFYI